MSVFYSARIFTRKQMWCIRLQTSPYKCLRPPQERVYGMISLPVIEAQTKIHVLTSTFFEEGAKCLFMGYFSGHAQKNHHFPRF